MASSKDIYEAAKVALDRVGGRVDIIVNNAGILSGQSFLETSDKKIELTMAVNFMSHMYMTKAFLPGMLRHVGGPLAAILNISSFASYVGAAQMVDYSASKFAARGFSESLSAELKQLGYAEKCRVSCICPAHIDTKLAKGFHVTGSMTMSPEFVAGKVVDAYENDQELVCLPRHLRPVMVFIGLAQSLGFYSFPNPTPKQSPLKNFDRSQADDVLRRMNAA